jgi:uncharacterized protein YndB with AHSA1/START domain
VPTFAVAAKDRAWMSTAPVVVTDTYRVGASPAQVFDLLADLAGWSRWHRGIRKVRLDGDGRTSGVGAQRTVWVGATRVSETFIEWEPAVRMTFAITGFNLPGVGAMVEDWAVAPDPANSGCSVVTMTIGVAPKGPLRHLAGVLRTVLARATKGGRGIEAAFG